ncbi:leucine-rich repeat domain-containing protein [Microcoleus sp. ARI1-B5]
MSEQQPNPAEFTSFADWCLHKNSLSPAARHTVEVLLYKTGTSDINEANRILSSRNNLSLYNNQISDITPLQSLTNLTDLNIYSNQISNLAPLQSLTYLRVLCLEDNQISNLAPLQFLTNLIHLNLYKNQISDITPLQSLTKLITLTLGNNQISDITPLQSLTNLTALYLHKNQMSDITPLQSLTKLTVLHLYNNQISDLTPLQSLTKLNNLSVDFTLVQNTLVQAYSQKWESLFKSTKPINHTQVATAVKTAYLAMGLKAPEIVFCSNPNEWIAEVKTHNRSNQNKTYLLKKLIQDKLPPFNLIEEFTQQLTDFLEQLPELMIWEELLEQKLEAEFYTGNIITPKYMFQALAHYELCVSGLGIVLQPEVQKVVDCLNQLLAECGWMFLLDDICIVCSRPCQIRLDSEYRLHAEGESALEYANGYKIYSYHGVTLPEKYGQIHPNQWQATWLLEEKNAELRRVLIHGIGYARIARELQATELDCWKEYTLLRIDADIDGFDPDDFDPTFFDPVYFGGDGNPPEK